MLWAMATMIHKEAGVPAEWLPTSNRVTRIVPGVRTGSWTRVAVPWHAAISYLAPFGYEDEAGFHYGEMPESNITTSLGEIAAENW